MYKVQLTQKAADFIRGQTQKVQKQLTDKLKKLGNNPRPPHCKKIQGSENLYRLRSGIYRILYQVFDDKVLVIVIRIGHRKDVYKHLND
jgi:mRNA interferase RelE/StbE